MQGQLSIFDLLETETKSFDPVAALAIRGTGFVDGMKRVREYFNRDRTIAEKAKFLKKEYGTGGFGTPTRKPCYIHSMDTFSNGKNDVEFEYYDENMNDISSGCSWEELAKTITRMIERNEY